MDRIFLIQYLINKYKYTRYLEIGTERGISFFPIRCKHKIAVDPKFKIVWEDKLKWYFKNTFNFRNKYFELTSDDFFLRKESFLKKKWKPEIIFIDGLHTFSATLKDVLNSLKFLQKDGIIILHDCFPPHKAAATKALNMEAAEQERMNIEGWTGEWCGDSWKAMVYLREKYPEHLKAVVIDADYGLGIVQILLNRDFDLNIDINLFNEIDKLQYEDLSENPEKIVGLAGKENYISL